MAQPSLADDDTCRVVAAAHLLAVLTSRPVRNFGAIYSYIHPNTGKYSSIWLYTGPSRHLVSPAQD